MHSANSLYHLVNAVWLLSDSLHSSVVTIQQNTELTDTDAGVCLNAYTLGREINRYANITAMVWNAIAVLESDMPYLYYVDNGVLFKMTVNQSTIQRVADVTAAAGTIAGNIYLNIRNTLEGSVWPPIGAWAAPGQKKVKCIITYAIWNWSPRPWWQTHKCLDSGLCCHSWNILEVSSI